MKLWNFNIGKKGKSRAGDNFSRWCQVMMKAPSFSWNVDVALDNEIYAHFGISSSEVLSQLRVRKSKACSQKHSSTY